ncbi:hypothetical protein T265_05482 [Opisthorchis viverrini]|uniref:Uncharacterized protein n=1 Tax=Opisthorchis viverrini TaxID=6198 RepID=A0A074ZKF5_OPIVI|nr:hypothetical protein T265_05482 [Opisthorchis viverrini]KER27526.1 hypothetical protein T265_05482 [Opisthorchis viverrini]
MRQIRQTDGPRKFRIADVVYARNFQGPEKWSSGTVLGKKGNVVYEVDVGQDVSTSYDQTTCKLNTGKKQKVSSGTSCLDDEHVRRLELSQNMTVPHSLQLRPNRKRKRPNWLQVPIRQRI